MDKSSFALYGCAADKVWLRLVANRKEKLGQEYSLWCDENENLQPDRIIADWDYSLGVPPVFARRKAPPRRLVRQETSHS